MLFFQYKEKIINCLLWYNVYIVYVYPHLPFWISYFVNKNIIMYKTHTENLILYILPHNFSQQKCFNLCLLVFFSLLFQFNVCVMTCMFLSVLCFYGFIAILNQIWYAIRILIADIIEFIWIYLFLCYIWEWLYKLGSNNIFFIFFVRHDTFFYFSLGFLFFYFFTPHPQSQKFIICDIPNLYNNNKFLTKLTLNT